HPPLPTDCTPRLYTRSLHDALPISEESVETPMASALVPTSNEPETTVSHIVEEENTETTAAQTSTECKEAVVRIKIALEEKASLDRKSTRLNSSHVKLSYAVFCLNK